MAHMLIISALIRPKQEDHDKLEASPVYTMSSGLATDTYQNRENWQMQITKWQEMNLKKEISMSPCRKDEIMETV